MSAHRSGIPVSSATKKSAQKNARATPMQGQGPFAAPSKLAQKTTRTTPMQGQGPYSASKSVQKHNMTTPRHGPSTKAAESTQKLAQAQRPPTQQELAQMTGDIASPAPMASVDHSYWLTILLRAVNENLDKLNLTKPIQMKDFDHLSGVVVRKVIIFLLCSTEDYEEADFYPPTGRTEPVDPNELKWFQSLHIDPTVHHLYWHVKRLFPENDETFDYSTLYFPAEDPQKTKAVLKYLTAFVMFNENISKKFLDAWEQCCTEIKEKEELVEVIDSLKKKINAKIVENQELEEALPQYKADLKEKTKKLQNLEVETKQLQKDVDKVRKNYDIFDAQNKVLESQLQTLQNKYRRWEEEQELKKEQEKITAKRKEQNALMEKMVVMEEIEDIVVTDIDDANEFASEMDRLYSTVETTVANAEKLCKLRKDKVVLAKNLEDEKLQLQKLVAETAKMKERYKETQRKLWSEKLSQIERHEQLQAKLEALKTKSDVSAGVIRDLVQVETKIQANIHKLQNVIAKNQEYSRVLIPNKLDELATQAKDKLEALARPLVDKVMQS